MNLTQIDYNKNAIIDRIDVNKNIIRRLYDLGFINGSRIYKTSSSIFNEPNCYKVFDLVIALRSEEESKIEVHYE